MLRVPSEPEQDAVHGLQLLARGSAFQLRHVAHTLLCQCLAIAGQPAVLDGGLHWWYLGSSGVQMGLFTASHMQQFLSSGVCQQQTLVCHDPSGVWLPLWLVLQVCGLMPAQQSQRSPSPAPAQQQQPQPQGAQSPPPGETAPLNSSPAPRQQQPQHHGNQASTHQSQQQGQATQKQQRKPGAQHTGSAAPKGVRAASSSNKPSSDDNDDDDEYGYGVSSEWLRKVKAVEAAAKAKQQQTKQQQERQQDGQAPASAQVAADAWADTEMQDAVMAAVSELRGDQEYLDELSRAVDMDWERTPSPIGEPVAAAAPAAATAAANDGTVGTCNAVDLAELTAQAAPAGAGAAAGSSLSVQAEVLLVLDTNVLLESKFLRVLRQLQALQRQSGQLVLQLPGSHSQGAGNGSSTAQAGSGGSGVQAAAVRVQAVIPWTVLVELDKLKLRPQLANSARAAVEVLRRELVAPHSRPEGQSTVAPFFVLQSLPEFRQAAIDHDPGVPPSSLSADDRILQCALSQQKIQAGLQAAGAGAEHGQHVCGGVLLLSNDKVMQLKAQASALRVAGLNSLAIPGANSSSNADHDQAAAEAAAQPQQLLPVLVQMLQLAGAQPAWLQAVAASRGKAFLQCSNASAQRPSKSGSSSPARHTGAPGSPVLSKKAAQKAAREQQLRQEQLTKSELSAAASSFLAFLRVTLSSTVLAWFQSEHEEHWRDVLVALPPWSDLAFVDVLRHHYTSTIKAHLVASQKHKAGHLKTTLDYLYAMAKRLQSHNFKGVDLHKLPSNLAVRVLEVLHGFGAKDAAQQVEASLAAAMAAASDTSSPAEDAASGPAGAPAAAGAQHSTAEAAAAPGSPSVGTRQAAGSQPGQAAGAAVAPVPNMHALVAAAEAAAAAAKATAEAAATPSTGDVASTGTAPFDPTTQQQQEQMQTQQQQGPSQGASAALTAALAQAAAAVAAPQLHGPCLFLSQLLLYAVSLLHAVLPPLSLHLSMPAADHTACSLSVAAAYEQQLRAAVQQLGLLGQQVDQQQWQQSAQGDILQLGLLLVQLCSLLLQDEAAGSAVSEQLMVHAAGFAAEAVVYLSTGQTQAGQAPGPAGMMQQLSAALQHLQLLLRQAMGAA